MNKEEQFKTLQNVIKDFVIDNKEFKTKEEAEKYVEENLQEDITALIEEDEDLRLNLIDLNIDGYEIYRVIYIRKFWQV